MSFPALSSITRKLFELPDYAQRENNICSMVNFFPEAKRLMDAISLERIVEIGSEAGLNTAVLLEYVKARGKQLVTVDPAKVPFPFSPEAEAAFTFFQETSAEFLNRDIPAEVIFMDGDHNYETVLTDLKKIHETRRKSNIKLLFLHDVSWPWARQDIYYDPARISHPHPFHAQNRVSPYADEKTASLSPANYMTSDSAGGAENGVLTAVEDFLTQYGSSWCFQRIPVLYGIGILIALDNITEEEKRRLLPLVDELVSHNELLSILELNRIENLCQYDSLQQKLNNAGDVWRKEQSYIKLVNEKIMPDLTVDIQKKQAKIEQLQRELSESAALCRSLQALRGQLETELEKCRQEAQRERDNARNMLWSKDQELRRLKLEVPSERWRIHQTPAMRLLPYQLRNAEKLDRISKMLSGGTVKLLSLDIFDTLLLREFRPELKRFSDTARNLHQRHPQISAESFYHARALAHQMAYQSCSVKEGCREASAELIFRIMTAILGCDGKLIPELRDEELKYEIKHLHLNSGIWKLVQLAQKENIPVIAVSDMYWSGVELKKILAALLPEPGVISKVYSSSDYGVSKLSGLLFDKVAQEQKADCTAILHIGDNLQSDFMVPFARNGIQSYWLPRSICYTRYCNFMQEHEKIKLQKRNILHGIR